MLAREFKDNCETIGPANLRKRVKSRKQRQLLKLKYSLKKDEEREQSALYLFFLSIECGELLLRCGGAHPIRIRRKWLSAEIVIGSHFMRC